MLRLNLFGGASIDGPDGPAGGRGAQGRRLALLALLACARGRAVKRDKLVAILWPESPTERARAQLSDDLYLVRSALGDDVIRSAGDELALNSDAMESDVGTFERLLDEGSLERAVELFAGPLLDGFHVADSQEFDRWLEAERTRLAARHAAALETLAEAAEGRAEFVAAAGWWRKLAALDPYSGRVSLRLMRALEAVGDRTGALRHARVHAALVREEFDADPDPDVTAFVERLRSEPPPRTRPATEPVATPAPRAPAEVSGSPAGNRDAIPTSSPVVAPITNEVAAARSSWSRSQAAVPALVLVLVVAAALAVAAVRGRPRAPARAVPVVPSVGVLPFVNMSADPANVYFSDGLTEQIITELSRIDGLRVAARTSSFALRDGALDVRAIGDMLGVAAVLEGSVRRDGNRLRITAQLIDAATGYHIWSDDYDRDLADVFAVQEEIAHAIAGALELRLAVGETTRASRPMPDLEAYDLYLRGLYLRNSLTAGALRQAMDYFDRAIARQPDFALAYAAKATVVAPAVLFGHLATEPGLAEYRALTARALELDPMLGEAHAALGIQRLFFDWEWEAAEQALRRAIALNPNDAHAFHHLGNYLRVVGRTGEAVAARARAVELDPLNARTINLLASDYRAAGHSERALLYYQRAFEIDPTHPLILGSGPWMPNNRALVFEQQGRLDEAIDEYIRVATLRGALPDELDELRSAFKAAGMPGFWARWLEMDLRQTDVPDPFRIAKLSLLSGDTTRAFDLLDRAYAERNPGLIFLNVDEVFANVRSHPRVTRILTAMKFPAP